MGAKSWDHSTVRPTFVPIEAGNANAYALRYIRIPFACALAR